MGSSSFFTYASEPVVVILFQIMKECEMRTPEEALPRGARFLGFILQARRGILEIKMLAGDWWEFLFSGR